VLESWPDADRKNVRGEFLIAPGETASFEVSTLDWVFRAKETPRRVADAVKKNGVVTFCLAGQTEATRDTACDDLGASATAIRLPGSHHFNGDYDAVGKAVLQFIDDRLR
jgi:type IV secretory pathway VirJ component